jgi:hypothetical protein
MGQGRDSSHFLLAWTRDRPAYSGACTTEPITENLPSGNFADNFSPSRIIPKNPGECIGGGFCSQAIGNQCSPILPDFGLLIWSDRPEPTPSDKM